MVLCLGASVTTLAAGSPSANNSSTTTSQTTTAATEVKVEQKAITQDALNDVQKEKLSGYFTDMAAIDNDTTLTAEQKVEKKASIGMLQRVFKIGFNRAARIMDQLAEAGVVGEEEGTKPRKVLMSMEQFEQYIEESV